MIDSAYMTHAFKATLELRSKTSILHYMKPTGNNFPTPDETGLLASITKEGNQSIERAIAGMKGRKFTVSFLPEDRAPIGRYAAENGNAAAVK